MADFHDLLRNKPVFLGLVVSLTTLFVNLAFKDIFGTNWSASVVLVRFFEVFSVVALSISLVPIVLTIFGREISQLWIYVVISSVFVLTEVVPDVAANVLTPQQLFARVLFRFGLLFGFLLAYDALKLEER